MPLDRIDIAAAQAAPGFLGVVTEADLRAQGLGPLPGVAQVAAVDSLIVPPGSERPQHPAAS